MTCCSYSASWWCLAAGCGHTAVQACHGCAPPWRSQCRTAPATPICMMSVSDSCKLRQVARAAGAGGGGRARRRALARSGSCPRPRASPARTVACCPRPLARAPSALRSPPWSGITWRPRGTRRAPALPLPAPPMQHPSQTRRLARPQCAPAQRRPPRRSPKTPSGVGHPVMSDQSGHLPVLHLRPSRIVLLASGMPVVPRMLLSFIYFTT